MKKFMLIAMMVASAGLLQAAQVAWTAGGGSGLGANGYIYAMTGTASDYAAVQLLLANDDLAGFQSWYGGLTTVHEVVGTLGADSTVALGAGQTLANGTQNNSSFGAMPDVFAPLSQQSVFYVIFNSSDLTSEDLKYSVSQFYTQDLNNTGSKAYTITWANWGGTGVSGSGMWQEIIPEPTAMALLALGAAALGLRRRFRK